MQTAAITELEALSVHELLGKINPHYDSAVKRKAQRKVMQTVTNPSINSTEYDAIHTLSAPAPTPATTDNQTALTDPDAVVASAETDQSILPQVEVFSADPAVDQVHTMGQPILIDDPINWPKFNLTNPNTPNALGYLMVPIATLGEWKHELYGDVVFNQTDFDQIVQNFNSRVTGYEPPLYLGHATDVNTWGDRPAVAFLESLAQKDDVLWGFYSVVDADVYLDVKQGKYRYSSAEIVRGYKNSKTNEDVGVLLHACALTNTPFLTDMPRVRAFAQQAADQTCTQKFMAFSFPLTIDSCTRDSVEYAAATIDFQSNEVPPNPLNPSMSETPVTPTEQLSVPTAESALNQVLEATNRALEAELSQIKAQLQTVLQENAGFKQAFAAQKQEQRLAVLTKANLSSAAKEAFSLALSAPNLEDAAADQIVAAIEKMSATEADTYLSQQGSTVTPEVVAEQVTHEKEAHIKQNFAYQSYLSNRAARAKK